MLRIVRPLPIDSLQLLVFDLDGTLIDSRQDLCNSVNATLEHLHLRPQPDEVIASFIGDGAAMLIRRALADAAESLFDQAFAYFLAYYRAHKLDYTTVYPGVLESLEALKTFPDGTPRKMAVLTNKPVGPAKAICDGLGLSPYFFSIYGGDSFPTKKPDPLGLHTLMTESGATPEETVMIGDSDVDMLTARNAGTWSMACTFGLAPESLEEVTPDAFADHASAWALALGGAEIEA